MMIDAIEYLTAHAQMCKMNLLKGGRKNDKL